jgi:hypothetical protein
MWQSLKGVHNIAMLAATEDFATEGNKVVWLDFKDIYEVYHQDALSTDLRLVSVSGVFFMFMN